MLGIAENNSRLRDAGIPTLILSDSLNPEIKPVDDLRSRFPNRIGTGSDDDDERDLDMGDDELLESIESLSTEDEVRMALDQTMKAESAIEVSLETLFHKVAKSASYRASKISSLSSGLANVNNIVVQLSDQLHSNAASAKTVSRRVRELDVLVTRIHKALQCVEDVIELRSCADGLQGALGSGDLDTACTYAKSFLRLKDSESVRDGEAFAAVSQLDHGLKVLVDRIREEADKVLNTSLNPSVPSDSVASVSRMIQVASRFVATGLADEGLSRFGDFVQKAVKLESDSDIQRMIRSKAVGMLLQYSGAEQPHVVTLTSLFEIVAAYADESERGLATAFGEDAVRYVIKRLQNQCDVQAREILSDYSRIRSLDEIDSNIASGSVHARDLDPLLDEIAIISQRTTAFFGFILQRTSVDESRPGEDSGEVVHQTSGSGPLPLATGASSVSSSSNLPSANDRSGSMLGPRSPSLSLQTRSPSAAQNQTEWERGNAANTQDNTEETSFEFYLRQTGLAKVVGDLSAKYVSMESYFMNQNINKAIEIDEPPPVGGAIRFSSAVDDVFFVFQKCLRRAVSYASMDTLYLVLTAICNTLNKDVLGFVKHRLTETNHLSGTSATSSSITSSANLSLFVDLTSKTSVSIDKKDGHFPPAKYGFSVSLNNASVASEYVLKLKSGIERDANSVIRNNRDRTLLNQGLFQITEASRLLAAAGEEGMDQLANALANRMKQSMDMLNKVNYLIDEREYSSGYDTSDEFVQAFISEMDTRALPGLEEKLMETNWDSLIRRLAEWAARRIEAVVMPVSASARGSGSGSSSISSTSADSSAPGSRGRRFTSLGALRFDRDVRALGAYFASKSHRGSVRDVFARLSQVSLLVNLEKPEEIFDLWGPNAGGMTWRLTPSEVRRALGLRTDFSAESIKGLKL